ncbi:MAG: hypothetical protein LDLANPLL_02081 [Turneriella sp.]|nr:hypothetical protein [Turneriella sp.]
MLWPYLFFSFVSAVLFYKGYYIASFLTVLIALFFFILDFFRIGRPLFYIAALGCILGIYLFSLRIPYLARPKENLEEGTANVVGVSRKSVVVERDDKIKLRLLGFNEKNLPVKHARIGYTCKKRTERKSTFRTLESLSGVAAWCTVEKIQTLSIEAGVITSLRTRILKFLHRRFQEISPTQKTLAAAFLLGDTDGLEEEELDAFRSMGLMHLFAVSGLNIALLFGLLYIPFRLIGQKMLGSILGYLVATAFLLLLDFPVPLLRAWIFMTTSLAMFLFDRKIPTWTLLFLTALLVEILFPLSTFSMSFILSFGITAAILIFYEPLYFCLDKRIKFTKLLVEHFSLTLAAGLPALVLGYLLFGQANPLSLFYNLLLVPFSGIYLFFGLLFLVFDSAKYILVLLDNLYLKFAHLHQAYISSYFPLAEPTTQKISLLCVALFLLILYITKLRQRLWSVKKITGAISLFLSAVLFLPYFIVSYPTHAFYAIPNKVWLYQEKTLITTGAALFNKSEKFVKTCFPIHKRKTLEKDKLLPDEIVKIGGTCTIFSGRMQPEKWKSNALSGCTQIYLLQSKKSQISASGWEPFFRVLGFKGSVEVRNFFTWYSDKSVACQ